MFNTDQPLQLLRRHDVLSRTGISKSCVYIKIKNGTFPPPVALGVRSVAWPAHEVEAIIRAMVAGKDDEAMKNLVKNLLLLRKTVE